jgi:hypothetical protein
VTCGPGAVAAGFGAPFAAGVGSDEVTHTPWGVAGTQLGRGRSGEHVDRVVCELSQGDAGGRGGCGVVAVEPTIAHDQFGVGSMGDSPVQGSNGVVDAVDRGLCGWSGIVGAEGAQPAKGVS